MSSRLNDLPILNRALSADEREELLVGLDAAPGTPLTLFVCRRGWQKNPVHHAQSITVPAPPLWDRAALLMLIRHALLVAGETDGAHAAGAEVRQLGPTFHHYCRLSKGRLIDRCSGHRVVEAIVDRDVLFLQFRTSNSWYAVTLPAFPVAAVVEMLCDPEISTDVTWEMLRSPAVVDEENLAPRPLTIRKVEPRRKASKTPARKRAA